MFSGGQTFLSFQWDLFLLETSFSAILYAPWSSITCDDGAAAHPMTWVLRVQWVKFMLMSGSVKVFAQCPTWAELTALRTDVEAFASQFPTIGFDESSMRYP